MRLFTDWKTWAQAESALRERLPAATVAALGAAVEFALAHHGDQTRPTGAPYLEHLLETVEVLVVGAGVTDPTVLTAAVLHDVVEDTPCTVAQVAQRFGPQVAELVRWATKPDPGPGADKQAVRETYLRSFATAPRAAKLVKLADRVSNVQTLDRMDAAFQRRYFAETVAHIVPLAAGEPWFASWYADWRRRYAHLAG